jgi:hypothetical protein
MLVALAIAVCCVVLLAQLSRCGTSSSPRRRVELLQLEPRVAFCGTAALQPVTAALEPAPSLAGPIIAENLTTPTLCAELDNVNIPLSVPAPQFGLSFLIEARHPVYPIGKGVTVADFSNCPEMGPSDRGPQQTTHVYDDHVATAVQAVRDPNFHQPGMRVRVGKSTLRDVHFIRIIRKIADANSWPEVLVLYSDGNLRLKPQAPHGGADPVFGSSVVVGPASRGERPVAQIRSVTYVPARRTLRVTYAAGGGAIMRILSVGRDLTRVSVNALYLASPGRPFAILRSMYVDDGNSDVDTVAWQGAGGGSSGTASVRHFQAASEERFGFGRAIWSRHNTSAPDLWVGNLKLRRR